MSAMPLPPLYVDLDGTLIATDLLHESSLQLVRMAPGALLQLPAWLLSGKAALKRRIAERVRLDAASLPYREPVLEAIRRARRQGRRVVLATASDRALAEAVAAHLGLFDAVLASDGQRNLSGPHKLEAIRADAAGQPFSYAGDGAVDLAVWQGAQSAIVVSNSSRLRQRVRAATRVEAEIDVPRAGWRELLYGIRLHQWLKNLLVFVPLLPILDQTTLGMALAALAMFVAFGLCASAIYLVNDLLDLEADRQHHRKKKRPIAAGTLPIGQAIALAAGLLMASAALAFTSLPLPAIGVLAGYVLLTSAYSLWLKRRMLVDVFALAALYTVRILAGMAAARVESSFWLLGFSMFMFLSLALVKRYVEIGDLNSSGLSQAHGRAYRAGDSVFVLAAGMSAGQLSVLTLSLYLTEPTMTQRYAHPYLLWLLCPLLLYWLVRVWLKGHRGQLHDDPVVFAATDRISQVILLAAVGLVYLAL
jgi:4-hydroxybenzoate polyprenyltransferase/phosphoserine phosphatase